MSNGFLVLSRRVGETLVIGGNIEVTISEINRTQVRVAINAPKEIKVVRKELLGSDHHDKVMAATR